MTNLLREENRSCWLAESLDVTWAWFCIVFSCRLYYDHALRQVDQQKLYMITLFLRNTCLCEIVYTCLVAFFELHRYNYQNIREVKTSSLYKLIQPGRSHLPDTTKSCQALKPAIVPLDLFGVASIPPRQGHTYSAGVRASVFQWGFPQVVISTGWKDFKIPTYHLFASVKKKKKKRERENMDLSGNIQYVEAD